ncbi:MAG: ubiquinol-cytochrome c reductase iron-sulfur subunit [Alphaproteobacteria bacterium]|uniref:Ubiquinol-cytochrome c reductase iron-sulfur subunit n=1 Tax=Candidatus Nitrobium versatile TaxID=2884831 RepID=A0A953JCJ8_9BACT|nr:ubiquinol-cytochrome c reductase iron-sulfur subunit [Candidatus Nitrobium versatile]
MESGPYSSDTLPDKGPGNGPLEGQQETTRRRFLLWIVGSLAALNALILGIPFIKALVGSSSAPKREPWIPVADLGSVPERKPTRVRFQVESEEAFFHTPVLHSVWVIKHSPRQVTVFSPICPHLGCHFLWNGQMNRFECPCHASAFAPDGRVLGGPAPRPLDTLPVRIENGTLLVQWKRFKVGIPEKVTA